MHTCIHKCANAWPQLTRQRSRNDEGQRNTSTDAHMHSRARVHMNEIQGVPSQMLFKKSIYLSFWAKYFYSENCYSLLLQSLYAKDQKCEMVNFAVIKINFLRLISTTAIFPLTCKFKRVIFVQYLFIRYHIL